MGRDKILDVSSIEAFKFFTVDSNVFLGVISLIYAYYDFKILKNKINEIPEIIKILKHTATVGVVLTFLTTVLYLAPFSGHSYFLFFKNSNLFFHLIIPILSIVAYLLFEKEPKNKNTIYVGMIPMALYSVFYVSNYIINYDASNPKINDWYGFVKNSFLNATLSILIMFFLTFLISYFLFKINKKLSIDK